MRNFAQNIEIEKNNLLNLLRILGHVNILNIRFVIYA